MNKKYAQFLLESVVSRYRLYPNEKEVLGVTKERFFQLFNGIVPGYQNLNETTKLQAIQGFLSNVALAEPEINTEALPAETREAVNVVGDYYQLNQSSQKGNLQPSQFQAVNMGIDNVLTKSPSPFGNLASLAAQKAVGEVVKRSALKGVLTAAGAATGGVGLIVAQFAPQAISWLKRNGKYVVASVGALIGFGLAGIGGALAGGGLGFVAGGGIAGGTAGISAAAGSLAAGTQSAIYGVAGAAVGAISLPLGAAVLGTPILIAIILFIINSGAYVVPPADYSFYREGIGGEYPKCWPVYGAISQGPECETGNGSHCRYDSNAIDIAGARGTPIYATHDGRVSTVSTRPWGGGYGNYVIITSEHGFATLYGHMLAIHVTPGQEVKAGGLIGTTDGADSDSNPGNSTGPHLHYELRNSVYSVNQIVPPYQRFAATSGCFARDTGGQEEPPSQSEE